MTCVSNLEAGDIKDFIGDYRCRQPEWRTNGSGRLHLRCKLEDYTGSIIAHAVEGEFYTPDNITDMDRIMVSGRLHQFSNRKVAQIREIIRIRPEDYPGSRLLPVSECPVADSLRELYKIESCIENKFLRGFIQDVFSNDLIALPFIRFPASMNHHHSQPGGLLVHSLECTRIVSHMVELAADMKELGMVAALFHDIGKIRVFQDGNKRSHEGYVLHHDAITLETLAKPLVRLEKVWPDGALALRYLWTWQTGNGNHLPLMPVALAVQMADRLSAAGDAERQAFQSVGDSQFASLNCSGPRNKFWRPSTTKLQSEVR